jgi:hypothetical protein
MQEMDHLGEIPEHAAFQRSEALVERGIRR